MVCLIVNLHISVKNYTLVFLYGRFAFKHETNGTPVNEISCQDFDYKELHLRTFNSSFHCL